MEQLFNRMDALKQIVRLCKHHTDVDMYKYSIGQLEIQLDIFSGQLTVIKRMIDTYDVRYAELISTSDRSISNMETLVGMIQVELNTPPETIGPV